MRVTHPAAAAAARTAIATAILLVFLFPSPACSDIRQQRSGTQPAHYQLAANWSHSETQSSFHDDPSVRTRAMLGQTSEDAAAIEAAAEVQQAVKREAAAQAEREAEEAEVAAEFAAGAISAADPAAAAEQQTQLGSAVATPDGISITQAYKLLNATAAADPKLMKPLPAEGRAVMKRHRTCAAFFMRPLARIALVGNGPLTEAQRLEVAASDLVIRFNKMNNRCLFVYCDVCNVLFHLPGCRRGLETPSSWRHADWSPVPFRDARLGCALHTSPWSGRGSCMAHDCGPFRKHHAVSRFCGERVDVWLLRHAAEDAKLRWHGLGELAHCQTAEVLASSPVLWMFGGESLLPPSPTPQHLIAHLSGRDASPGAMLCFALSHPVSEVPLEPAGTEDVQLFWADSCLAQPCCAAFMLSLSRRVSIDSFHTRRLRMVVQPVHRHGGGGGVPADPEAADVAGHSLRALEEPVPGVCRAAGQPLHWLDR